MSRASLLKACHGVESGSVDLLLARRYHSRFDTTSVEAEGDASRRGKVSSMSPMKYNAYILWE